jgi:putative heme-binding domain-containing protein
LGPDLTQRREVAVQELIEAVLTPSKKIREGFETQVFALVDGRQLSGVVASEDEQAIRLDRIEEPDQPLVLDPEDVLDRRRSEVSMMPVGLANQLRDRKEFLDLIRYLVELSREGPARAVQLRPATASLALAPLPPYESALDHRGLIESWNQESLRRGAEIFRLRCASCHGDLQNEGSMPTSMRFASGQFKNGSDPFAMYRTLTHGYGMMIPQRWMVPEEKYAVIQYIRETFLREHNPTQLFEISDAYLADLPKGNTRGPQPVSGQPWSAMNYGPSLINTIEVPGPDRNVAQKGITIRLDEGPGGVESGRYWLMYDHDTMRVAGAWSDSFIDYEGIHFNGVHGRHPRANGVIHFRNPDGPGWGRPEDGSFEDVRLVGRDDRHYGPLPRDWAQYRGLYRHGNLTVLKYRVGATEILETPGIRFTESQPTFIRTLELGPRETDLVVGITRTEMPLENVDGFLIATLDTPPSADSGAGPFNGRRFYQRPDAASLDTHRGDFSVVARVRTDADGTIWSKTRDQDQWLADGQSLFIRGGRLTLDVGWVGAVRGSKKINDGRWHEVGLSYRGATGEVTLFVDGQVDGKQNLAPKGPLADAVMRIGFTNKNFPQKSHFEGEMEQLVVCRSALAVASFEEVDSLDESKRFAEWTSGEAGDKSNDETQASFVLVDPIVESRKPVQQFVSAHWEGRPVDSDAWILNADGDVRLRIPAGTEPLRLMVQMTSCVAAAEAEEIRADHLAHGQSIALRPLTQGGSPNWPEVLETEVVAGPERGAFAVDILTHPVENPGNCRLRMTGLDFVPGADAMMVSTWDGSVWRVDGIGQGRGATLKWRRFAAGLFQPLGVKYRDGVLFVTCRDQLVALHDMNDDGEADWYECFNSDHQVTEHFHEFAMGLQIDPEGNFYYAKSARHALPALVPHHGTLLKVSADGQATSIVANGFRAANGVCINPDGTFVVTDQEGHWNPKNRINWVSPGGFYGNMFGYHDVTDPSDDAMDPPLCWITNSFDRSPAELLWVDSERWGSLNGSLLNFSYGYGRVYVVPHESVDGQMQGGMCAFDLPQFPTGIMRGRFHPADGQLYSCGMFAWSSTQEQPGGLYRIRRLEDQPANLPIGLHAKPGQILIEFSDPLDPESVAKTENFAVKIWGLKRSANYGSEHYNEQTIKVAEARLLDDARTVVLTIPELEPTWCMEIVYVLRDSSGHAVENRIHNTIHHLKQD